MGKMRILFLYPVMVTPKDITIVEKIREFNKYYSGDIITAVQNPKDLGIQKISGFNFHPIIFGSKNSFFRNGKNTVLMLKKAFSIFKKNKFDLIISPNPLLTGLMAIFIGKFTKAKVIVEVNGNFESAFKFETEGKAKQYTELIKDKIAKKIIPFVLRKADMVKLVYKDQLSPLKIDSEKIKTTSFPNFVAIKHFLEHEKKDDNYILLLGYPWYLKGVDILIKAFNKISKKYPNYKLKVVGWCPEGKEYFEDLKNGNPNIELNDPVYYDEVIKLMAKCSLYVLASRTDSSPRVLREAMASKKPIIASNVDGVPILIKDGFNGLLFESENADDLTEKIETVLDNGELANKLAQNGYEYVQENLSEQCYINHYIEMINKVLE